MPSSRRNDANKKAAAEVLRYSQEVLEQQVRERTRELEAANEALRQEVAQRKRAEEALRRAAEVNAFQAALTDALRPIADPIVIQEVATRMLGQHLGASRVMYGEVADNDADLVVERNYVSDGQPLVIGRFRMADFGTALVTALTAGRTLVLPDIANAAELLERERGAYAAIGIAALAGVPLVKGGRFVANLNVHQAAPRTWTADEVALIEETAERTWADVERARAKAALRESEEKYRTLFNSMDEGFCIIEVLFDQNEKAYDYRILEANPAFEKHTGLVGAIGKAVRELAPEHEAHWFEIYGKVALTGEPVRFENPAQALGRFYDVYAFRIGLPTERRVAVLFTDITERKRTEEALRESEARQAFLLKLSDALHPLSAAVEVQATASRVLGEHLGANRVTYFEVVGADYVVERDYVDGVPHIAGAYPIKAFGAKLLAAYRAGESVVVSDITAEAELAQAERAAYQAIQIGAHIGVPLVKGGQFVAGLAVHSSTPRAWTKLEIALVKETAERTWAAVERARAEEALRESEERLRLLIESATDYAIFTMDIANIINSWNTGAERLFGWTAEEAIGQPGAMIFTPEDRAAGAPEKEVKTARDTGHALDERFHLRKDGSRFYVSGSVSPLCHNDQLVGYVKIARDLTERKRAEEELEKRVQERTRELRESEAQLRGMASRLTLAEQEERHRVGQILHDDLQQLLYGIQLRIEFIQQSIETDQRERLRTEAQRAIHWIEDAITKTRRLTVDLSPPVLPQEGLTGTLSWLVTQMRELHGLQITVEAEHSFRIADEGMRVLLFQIIRELLFNVVKHAETDRARVVLCEEAGHLVIRVSDEGRGFEVETGEVEREQGFGLRSMRERLSLLGGRMEIVSQPGEGTQITIYTPVTPK